MPLLLVVGVPAVVVAVMYLLFLYANTTFRNGMIRLLSALPGWLADVLTAVVNGAAGLFTWALDWAKVAVYPVVQLLWVPVQAILAFAGQVIGTLEVMATFVVALPGQIASVTAWATAELSALITRLAALAVRVTAVAATIPDIARAVAVALVDAAVAHLEAAITAARASLAAAISAAALTAAAEVGQLRAWTAAQVSAVALALSSAVATLDHVTGWELPDIRGQLAKLAEGLGLLTAANLIGRLLTLEQTVTTTIEECVTPTCNVIGPQLGTLQALMDIGLVLAVGALVGEAVRDPEGAARGTAEAVGGITAAAGSLGQALTGVGL